jgi:hypothetical protein
MEATIRRPAKSEAHSRPQRSNRRRFEFEKRSQLFIRTHNETLCIVAMCVSNKDRFGTCSRHWSSA